MESMIEHKDPIPASDLAMDEIRRFKPVLNTSALARLTDINQNTLRSKIDRGTPFSKDEARAIQTALDL